MKAVVELVKQNNNITKCFVMFLRRMLQEKEAKEKAISSQKKSANERYKEADKMVADYKFVTL